MAGVGEKSWQLSLRADADLSSLRRRKNEVARALKDLETAGINHFDAHPGRRDRGEADLFGVRFPQVDDAWAFKPSERGPMVVLVGPGHVSSIGPELVTQVIENFASHPKREGDRRKLRRAATPQTHLFVWLEPHEFGAYESLCGEGLPENVPSIPAEITSIWVAAQCRDGRTRALFVRPPAPWQEI